MNAKAAALAKRLDAIEAKLKPRVAPVDFLSSVLFKEQLPFGLDTARHQTAVTPRRAGKTHADAAKLLAVALAKPGSVALYITLSRLNAKRIVWSTLKELNHQYALGGEIGEADLCITFPNKSRVFLSGANDKSEVEKFRGLALSIVIIDEAQSFPSYLESLVDEVLVPALTDYAGSLCLVGTPGPVPVGYFHDACHSAEWSHHTWSVFDNVHLAKKSGRSTQSLLEDELKRRGVTADDPVIQREWYGRWLLDENSLVFRFDMQRNTRIAPRCAHYVLCIDVGYDDSDAIGVLGWNDSSPDLYLVEEWVGAKQTITPLMGRVSDFHRRYSPIAVVMDMGGLGKKIGAEISERTGIGVEAAEKERKLEHIELLNDALRTGRFHAPADSRFAQDCMKVEWDKSNPEKWKISARFHSDICDAILYGFRKALQWLYIEPPKPRPARDTPEFAELEQTETLRELEATFEEQMRINQERVREENSQWA